MIITTEELPNLNLSGKIVGLTSGCFDLVHFYHLHYLERCKAHCDFLIVGVDARIELFKLKQPEAINECYIVEEYKDGREIAEFLKNDQTPQS